MKKRSVWEAVIGLFLILATIIIVNRDVESRFRVIYSLDRRQNNQEIVRLINDADKYVYFAIYYFTEKDIADALINAKERGLIVFGIMDAEATTDSNKQIVEKLRAAGVNIETQKHVDGIMHMKVLVTDRAYASGSYNWTQSATESNDEVLEIGTDDGVRRQYLEIVKKVLLVNGS